MSEATTLQDTSPVPHARPKSKRIASIDWMRGFVMILMVIDHASMAFNCSRLAADSAADYTPGTPLPAFEFLTRWISHICAPTFVFLAGTALAISMERRLARGQDPREIDRNILTRGLIILVLDFTLISLGSGRWTVQVLYAIGGAMMCMAFFRRFSTPMLLFVGLGWFAVGEVLTALVWQPPGWGSPTSAFFLTVYGSVDLVIKYPLLPWLAMMILGWVFGRYLTSKLSQGDADSPRRMMLWVGLFCMAVFLLTRGINGYGNLWLYRDDGSWQQWLHVSKYPPSLSFASLELGLMCLCLWGMMHLERAFGVRQNGPLLVFGQTAMFFYLVHRMVFEVPATWFGLRGFGGLTATYVISAAMLISLYPACRWYRTYKRAHPESWVRFF